MTLSRTVVVPGMTAQYLDFVELLRGLTGEQWETPSRCQGWRVADVAAHVVGQLTDVTNLRLEGLGTPEVTQRQVEERRGRSAADLADELEGSAASRCGSTPFSTPTTSAPPSVGRLSSVPVCRPRCRTSLRSSPPRAGDPPP